MSILDRLNPQAGQTGRRPPGAAEIAPEGILAAALPAAGSAPVVAFAALPAGAVVPGIGEANLRAKETVSAALKTALDQVSPRSRSITLVVPDTAARVFVLDFDTLPSRLAEALPILRFRLRKVVPFDVEHAAVSYQILSNDREGVQVLTTVMPAELQTEYETAVRDAGYEPGAIMPAGLAALAALDTTEAALVAHLGSTSLTTAITSGQNLLLYRTIELPEQPEARLAEVQRGIAVAAAYYEDRMTVAPPHVHYAGSVDAARFAEAIAASGLGVTEIAPTPTTGVLTTMGPVAFAPVAGSLAGAAA